MMGIRMVKKWFIINLLLIFFCLNLQARKITVKVFNDSRMSFTLLSGATLDFGSLMVSDSYMTSRDVGRIILKNDGTIPISFALKIKVTSSPLKPVSGTPGLNEFRLFGLFHQWEDSPDKGDFDSDDLITTQYRYSSSNVFAELKYDEWLKGYNVNVGAEQNLFLRFDAPSQVSSSPMSASATLYIKAFLYEEEEEPHKKPKEKIFTPNGDGINDFLVFHGLSDLLNNKDEFYIKIMDTRGRIVKTLREYEYWDGKDGDGHYVESGAYIYQYKYGDEYVTGVVIIAK